MAIVLGVSALIKKRADKKRLDQCLIVDPTDEVEVFEYKGNLYMRDEYVGLFSQSLIEGGSNLTLKQYLKVLQDDLGFWKEELTRTKYPGFIQAKIDATEIALQKLSNR